MPKTIASEKSTKEETPGRRIIAFDGDRLLATGALSSVARAVKKAESHGLGGTVLVFDAETSEPVELDLRGSADEVVARLPTGTPSSDESRGPGRPHLGVIGREVTLLPRHWEWLAAQPGGASAALRRLVDHARTTSVGRDRRRRAQEYAYRFLSAMLGDAVGFEEATRALFADDRVRFESLSQSWPVDLRDHARRLAAAALTA